MSRRRGAATSRAASGASWANGALTNISMSNRCTSTCQRNQSTGSRLDNTVAAGFSRPSNVRLKADATRDFTEAANMTYYGGKELADAFRTVRKNTIQIAE